MTPEQRREAARVTYGFKRAMAKAAKHKATAEREGEHTLNHWHWAAHYTREATELARQLQELTGKTEVAATQEDIR